MPLEISGNFAKTIFYFLRADEYSLREMTGKPFNLGDRDGVQVPCKLKFTGGGQFGNILEIRLKS